MEKKELNYKVVNLQNGTSCVKLYDKYGYFQIFINANILSFDSFNDSFLCVPLTQKLSHTLKKLEGFLFHEIIAQDYKKEIKYLNIFDDYNAGLSQRDIARMLYPEEACLSNWHSDSWLRARVRYNIRKAKAMVNGNHLFFL